MSLSKRTLARAASRTPVRNAVENEWPDILEARNAGASLNAIFLELKADGKNVGSGYSSFLNAVRYFDKNPPATTGAKPIEQVIEDQSDDPHTTPSRDRFSDGRFSSDWG